MRKILKHWLGTIKSQAGFTMIELLVVISIIGILAVAVLSALNPIEQINKGKDTSTRSDAGELLSAAERYFAIHELYPWNEDRIAPTPNTFSSIGPFSTAFTFGIGTATTFSGTSLTANTLSHYSDGTQNWLWQLSDTQEVKPAYVTRIIQSGELILLRAAGANSSAYVCFIPRSYAFQLEAARNCKSGATLPTIAGFTTCGTVDGSIPAAGLPQNYQCLP